MILEYSKALATIVVAGLAVTTAQEKLEKITSADPSNRVLMSIYELVKGWIGCVSRRGSQES